MTWNKRMRPAELVYMGMFVALLAISAWLVIPSAVPFTMQTFAVFATVAILGMYKGTLIIVVYILLGIIGLPVFSGMNGGLGVLAGPTGGYIIGFVFSAMVTGAILKIFGRKTPVMAAAMIIGLLVCYAFGTVWFVLIYTNAGKMVEIWSVLTMCVLPYVIPDILKIILAIMLSRRVAKYIRWS